MNLILYIQIGSNIYINQKDNSVCDKSQRNEKLKHELI